MCILPRWKFKDDTFFKILGSDEVIASDIISPQSHNSNDDSLEILDESTILQQCEADTVLVVPLPDRQMNEPPGFLSEEHVISRYFVTF